MSHPRVHAPAPRGRTTTSFIRRVTTAPAKQGSLLTQQTVSSYKLSWENLKTYLEKKFPKDKYPKLEFKERKVRGNHRSTFACCIDVGHHTDQQRQVCFHGARGFDFGRYYSVSHCKFNALINGIG